MSQIETKQVLTVDAVQGVLDAATAAIDAADTATMAANDAAATATDLIVNEETGVLKQFDDKIIEIEGEVGAAIALITDPETGALKQVDDKIAEADAAILATNEATAEALASAGVDPAFISYEAGVLPNFSGAVEGTIGAYFTSQGVLQRIQWSGSAWISVGSGVLSSDLLPTNNILITVGDGDSLIEKLQLASYYRPLAKNGGVLVEVRLSAGYEWNQNLILKNIDLSFITLTSVDAIVSTTSGYTGNLLICENASAPNWNILVDMASRGISGIVLTQSRITINNGCGVINAPSIGLFANRGSYAGSNTASTDLGVVFTGCQYGIYSDHNGDLFLRNVDVSDATEAGAYIRSISRAVVPGIKATNCKIGVLVEDNSSVTIHGSSLRNTQINNCINGLIARDSSTIMADLKFESRPCEIKDNSQNNITLVRNCTMSHAFGVATGAGRNSVNCDASTYIGPSTNHSGAGLLGASGAFRDGLRFLNNSRFSLVNATVQNSVRHNVFSSASFGSISGASITGAGEHGVRAEGGSVYCESANASSAVGTGFSVARGAIINVTSATGTLSQTANTLTSSGIIFQ
jgi:hypothetical protein